MRKSRTNPTKERFMKDDRDLEKKPGRRTLPDAVGVKPNREVSKTYAIRSYKRLKAELGRVPMSREFYEQCCGNSTLRVLFGGSGWRVLLKSVGDYRRSRPYHPNAPTKTTLMNAFRSLRQQSGKAPSYKQYRERSGYSLSDLKYRFGEKAWRGLVSYEKFKMQPTSWSLSAEHLTRDFLELQRKLGRRPSISEYMSHCHTPKVLDRVFGKPGWKNMISAVGDKALPRNVIQASHLVDDYIEVSLRLGKKPSFEQFRKAQRHTMKVVERVFGRPGWSTLAKAARKRRAGKTP